MYQSSQDGESLGHNYGSAHSRTCTSSARLAIARQQASALLDDQIGAGDAELEGLGVRIDEA